MGIGRLLSIVPLSSLKILHLNSFERLRAKVPIFFPAFALGLAHWNWEVRRAPKSQEVIELERADQEGGQA